MKTLTTRLSHFATCLSNDVRKLQGRSTFEVLATVVCLVLLLVPAAVAIVVFGHGEPTAESYQRGWDI